MIILFLSGIIAAILAKTLRRDFLRYATFWIYSNTIRIEEDENELDDETGWKLLNADVFRAPRWPTLLCVLFGSGVQVLGMAVITMSKFAYPLQAYALSIFCPWLPLSCQSRQRRYRNDRSLRLDGFVGRICFVPSLSTLQGSF